MNAAEPLGSREARDAAGEDPGEQLRFRLTMACVLVLVGALAYPLFTGEVYTRDDLGALHLPLRDFYARCLEEGKRFLWMPGWLTGFHLHGEGQAGLYHPLNFLFYRLLPLSSAFTLELVRNHVFAFAGMFWFLRRSQLPRDASALGALAFGFSSHLFAHHMHLNAMGVLAHVPWLMGAADGVMRTTGRRRGLALCGVASLTASALLLGHPQFAWIALLSAGLYTGFVLLQTRCWAGAGLLVGAVGLGVLCAGVQLLPTLESVAASHRGAAVAGYASSLSLAPENLLQIVSPHLFRELGVGAPGYEFAIYPGIFAPLAWIWLWLRRDALGGLAPLALFSAWVGGIGLWLALGDVAGLHRLFSSLPGIGLFRAPARYAFLFGLGGALASAICLADLARLRPGAGGELPQRAWLLGQPLILASAIAGLTIAGRASGSWPADALSATPALLAGCAGAGLALGCLLAVVRGQRLALVGIVLLVAFDFGSYGIGYVWRVAPTTPEAYASQWRKPAGLGERRLNWGPPAMVMNDVRLASGYVALEPVRRLPVGRFDRPNTSGRSLLGALRLAEVGWAYDREVPDALPRARMLPTAVRIGDLQRQLIELDLRRVVLLDESVDLGGGAAGEATLQRDDPGEIEVWTEAPTRQLLVVSESHHPGWIARVDGEPCDVVRAYGDFLGCVVGPGRHQVMFSFEPRSVAHGRVLSGLGFGGVCVMAIFAWRRRD